MRTLTRTGGDEIVAMPFPRLLERYKYLIRNELAKRWGYYDGMTAIEDWEQECHVALADCQRKATEKPVKNFEGFYLATMHRRITNIWVKSQRACRRPVSGFVAYDTELHDSLHHAKEDREYTELIEEVADSLTADERAVFLHLLESEQEQDVEQRLATELRLKQSVVSRSLMRIREVVLSVIGRTG